MRRHQDAVFSLLLGFALTSAALLPPILDHQADKAARIASLEAAIGTGGEQFGAERQARLVYLLRHADEAEFDPFGEQRR